MLVKRPVEIFLPTLDLAQAREQARGSGVPLTCGDRSRVLDF